MVVVVVVVVVMVVVVVVVVVVVAAAVWWLLWLPIPRGCCRAGSIHQIAPAVFVASPLFVRLKVGSSPPLSQRSPEGKTRGWGDDLCLGRPLCNMMCKKVQ